MLPRCLKHRRASTVFEAPVCFRGAHRCASAMRGASARRAGVCRSHVGRHVHPRAAARCDVSAPLPAQWPRGPCRVRDWRYGSFGSLRVLRLEGANVSAGCFGTHRSSAPERRSAQHAGLAACAAAALTPSQHRTDTSQPAAGAGMAEPTGRSVTVRPLRRGTWIKPHSHITAVPVVIGTGSLVLDQTSFSHHSSTNHNCAAVTAALRKEPDV